MWVGRLLIALIGTFIGNILYVLDVLLNVLLGGDCRESVSSRLGRGKLAGKPVHSALSVIPDVLFFLVRQEVDHCTNNVIDLPNGDRYALSSVCDRVLTKYYTAQKYG